ncbi:MULTISPECIES: ABC transporter permease [Cryobacterium]|uniref:ABC transporter permease n=1 Tax=Cryobacterium TaxID=69578 RepID=UPI000CD48047|nr:MULTISPECIES: ABC transporter permease [Cryobacterium]POH69879.1 ABC transporter permease [Cryobacterium zongtaii]TFC42895.1 ABC transporter permease [Cryobacterium sp. TMN-39-2]
MSTYRSTHQAVGSDTDRSPSGLATGIRPAVGGIPFLRLCAVELRKQLDTRAGLWLLVAIALVNTGFIALTFFTADAASLAWTSLAESASLGQLLLLPLIGVMAATSEWSARTALSTFTLEPRRTRVNLAKLVSAGSLGLIVMVVTLLVSAALNLAGILWQGADGSWALNWGLVGGTALALVLLVWQGVAFGLAFLSTPVAIVAYLGLPTLWTVLTLTIESLRGPAEWLDVNTTLSVLMTGAMTADDWPRLAVSLVVWLGVPLAFGLWRTARREP